MFEEVKTVSSDDFECEIGVTVSEMLGLNLQIPDYQRPYTWKEKNVSDLFYDIYDAMKNENIKAYRIGTVILHRENKNIYNIVDGQQRIVSLYLLLNIFGQSPGELEVVNDSAGITLNHVGRNNKKLSRLVKTELKDKEARNKYIGYLKNNCEFVKITTESEEQAFQFFDSQNNRGKELELYDILKAYHLREMFDDKKPDVVEDDDKKYEDMCEMVEKWEKSESALQRLFNNYLYQINQWAKSRNGNTSKWKIIDEDIFFELFKGFSNKSECRYAQYHLQTKREFRQIDMPVISGQWFFEDIFEYLDIQKKIDRMCFDKYREEALIELIKPRNSDKLKYLDFRNNGDKYIYDMMGCAILFIVTKFTRNKKQLEPVWDKIFVWAWSLRLYNSPISKSTINNYSLGKGPTDKTVKMFNIISNSTTLRQILEIELELPKENEKYANLSGFIKDYLSGDIDE